MADFPITVTVDRSELGFADLELSADEGYYVSRGGIGPGPSTKRRTYAESVFVPGQRLVHSVADQVEQTLRIRVQGTSLNDLFYKIELLNQAFAQFNYQLDVDVDGETFTWDCDEADIVVGEGGNWNDLMLRSFTQMVDITFMRQP